MIGKCKYCFGGQHECDEELIVIQLSHDTREEENWQEPILSCAFCRDYLNGQWRKAKLR